MAVPPYLSKITSRQLKGFAFLLGLPTTGLKADLQNMLARRVAESPTRAQSSRILSIDMGIRNLGVCVLNAPRLSSSVQDATAMISSVTISAWEKVDVLAHLQAKTKSTLGFGHSDSAVIERTELEHIRHRPDNALTAGDFTPQNLAEAAYALVCSLLVQYQPTDILIERQRFRTFSGPAVQEWTLRVNLLEHMIWACLETLRTTSRQDSADKSALGAAVRGVETVSEVSPAKVAKFWCSGVKQDLGPEMEKGAGMLNMMSGTPAALKITKADKIAVVQGWVDAWKTGSGADDSVRLDFAGEAAQTAGAFQSVQGKRKARKKKGEEGDDVDSIGKLDDLADCLLQGVAWVKWEENRRKLAETVAKNLD